MVTSQWSWGTGLKASVTAHFGTQVKSVEQTLADLEEHLRGNSNQPVVVLLWEGAVKDAAGARLRMQEMQFKSVEAAVVGVRACLPPAAPSREAPSQDALTLAAFVRRARHLMPGHRDLSVRWRWDDVGLTEQVSWWRTLADLNGGRWSSTRDLQTTKATFAEYSGTQDALRPVALEFHASGHESTVMTFRMAVPTVVHAVDLLSVQCALKGRDEFLPDPDNEAADAEYDRYALCLMEENGGYVGASVRFTSQEPYAFVARGEEGVIESFTNSDRFKVDWGWHSAFVSMNQCTLIATADRRKLLVGVGANGALPSMMRAVAAKLRLLSREDPEAFANLCIRLPKQLKQPDAGSIAAEGGICEAVVEAMDRAGTSTPGHCSLQQQGCLLLWWVCSHDGDESKARFCRARAAEAGALAATVRAQRAFPADLDFLDLVCKLTAIIAEGNPRHRRMALDAGADEEWLR